MKKVYIILFLFIFVMTGCAGNVSKNKTIDIAKIKETHKEITIGVSLLSLQLQFYRDLKEGLEKTATDYGIKIKIYDSTLDLNKQIHDMEKMIADGVQGIILSPVDSKGVTEVVNKAKAAHISVVTVDTAADGAKVDSHIGSDNVLGGRLAGEYAVKLMGKKGNIAILNHDVVAAVLDRVKGFEEAIAKYPDIKIVANKDGGGMREMASLVTSEIIDAHPNIDLIYAINDDSLIGAVSTLEGTELSRKVSLISYDATPYQQELIKQGKMLKASIVQFPKEMGRESVETMLRLIDGQKVGEKVLVEVGILDKNGVKVIR